MYVNWVSLFKWHTYLFICQQINIAVSSLSNDLYFNPMLNNFEKFSGGTVSSKIRVYATLDEPGCDKNKAIPLLPLVYLSTGYILFSALQWLILTPVHHENWQKKTESALQNTILEIINETLNTIN